MNSTIFMLLDAICTLKDLDLRFWGQKHVFCRSGLMNVRLSEKISLKQDLGRTYPAHFAWASLGTRSSEIHQYNTFLRFFCSSAASSEVFSNQFFFITL